ncbi:MAG TPA: VTT domain-containing protein, partial [Candidatus Manganitrophaceae bacterium]
MKTETILNPGTNCFRISQTQQIDLLIDAAPYYQALYKCITEARESLLFLGWQFDSRVPLLRGEEAKRARYPVEFLPLLQAVAEERPSLQIYILAWDHSIVFAPEREWGQARRFNRSKSNQIHFRFDNVHPAGGSHHQKIVVADGTVGFCGGLDICGDRWDTPRHQRRNPLRRNPDGTSYDLFHDAQIAIQGEAVSILEEIFCERWAAATGERPISRGAKTTRKTADLPSSLRLSGGPVAISRTIPIGCCGQTTPILEIARLYEDAIAAAERFILIENQYFTSRRLFEALIKRITRKDRRPIEIVLILPEKTQNWKEHLAIGFEQRRLIQRLETTAKKHGSPLGVYTPVKRGIGDLPPQSIYVHSKILIVDHRLLSIGSANTTNRSLGLDTECNITLEAEDDHRREEIALASFTLLGEHLEESVDRVRREFERNGGWVAFLNSACRNGSSGRLKRWNSGDSESWVGQVVPEGLCFDPEAPQPETFFERALGGAASPPPFKGKALFKPAFLLALPLIGLLLFLFLRPQKEDILFWAGLLKQARDSRWTIPLFLTGAVFASLISFPISIVLILGGVLFGALWGTIINWTGALFGATASYLIGQYFGRPLIRRFGGGKIEAVNQWIQKKGFWAILLLRIVGIFPFTIVNICAGTS